MDARARPSGAWVLSQMQVSKGLSLKPSKHDLLSNARGARRVSAPHVRSVLLCEMAAVCSGTYQNRSPPERPLDQKYIITLLYGTLEVVHTQTAVHGH